MPSGRWIMDPCAGFETLLTMVQGGLAPADLERWSLHVAGCPRCTAEKQAIERTELALGALHAAELRAARTPDRWAAIAAAAARPPLLLRLPPALTDAVRTSRTLAQPAIAGTFAAVILGLSMGTWLALSTQHAPATAEAAETYSASSLLASPSSGIAEDYFDAANRAGGGGAADGADGVGAADGGRGADTARGLGDSIRGGGDVR